MRELFSLSWLEVRSLDHVSGPESTRSVEKDLCLELLSAETSSLILALHLCEEARGQVVSVV